MQCTVFNRKKINPANNLQSLNYIIDCTDWKLNRLEKLWSLIKILLRIRTLLFFNFVFDYFSHDEKILSIGDICVWICYLSMFITSFNDINLKLIIYFLTLILFNASCILRTFLTITAPALHTFVILILSSFHFKTNKT